MIIGIGIIVLQLVVISICVATIRNCDKMIRRIDRE